MGIRLLQILVFFAIAELGSLFPGLNSFRPFFVIATLTVFVCGIERNRFASGSSKDSKSIAWFVVLLAFSEVFPAVFSLYLTLLWENFLTWFKIVLVFFLAYEIIRSEEDVRRVFTAVIFGLLVHLYVATRIYTDRPELMLQGRLASYGMYMGANDYGLLLTCSLAIVLKMAEFYKGLGIKALLYGIGGAIVLHVFLTGSRGSLIGASVVIVLSFWTRLRSSKAIRVAMIALIVGVVVIVGGQKLAELRPTAEMLGGDDSAIARLDAWAACGRMLLSNPLGVGFEQSKEFMKEHGMYSSMPPHNTYVKVAAEAGILGFLAYVVILYLVINRLMKLEYYYRIISPDRKAIVFQALLILLVGFMINTSLSQKEYEWLLYIALACSARVISNESEVLKQKWT